MGVDTPPSWGVGFGLQIGQSRQGYGVVMESPTSAFDERFQMRQQLERVTSQLADPNLTEVRKFVLRERQKELQRKLQQRTGASAQPTLVVPDYTLWEKRNEMQVPSRNAAETSVSGTMNGLESGSVEQKEAPPVGAIADGYQAHLDFVSSQDRYVKRKSEAHADSYSHDHYCPVCRNEWTHGDPHCLSAEEYWCDAHVGTEPLPSRLSNDLHDHYCEDCFCFWGHRDRQCRLPDVYACIEHGGVLDDDYIAVLEREAESDIAKAPRKSMEARLRGFYISSVRFIAILGSPLIGWAVGHYLLRINFSSGGWDYDAGAPTDEEGRILAQQFPDSWHEFGQRLLHGTLSLFDTVVFLGVIFVSMSVLLHYAECLEKRKPFALKAAWTELFRFGRPKPSAQERVTRNA